MSLEDYPFTAIHAFVEETCGEIGLPVHDLLPAFQGKRDRELWVHQTDHHPNEIAHEIAARSLEEFVRSQLGVNAATTDSSQSP